jgi:hypothetical protein
VKEYGFTVRAGHFCFRSLFASSFPRQRRFALEAHRTLTLAVVAEAGPGGFLRHLNPTAEIGRAVPPKWAFRLNGNASARSMLNIIETEDKAKKAPDCVFEATTQNYVKSFA